MIRLAAIFIMALSSSVHASEVRIATWNLGGFYQIKPSNLNQIASGLLQLNADIVVLTELNPMSSASFLSNRLNDETGKCYENTVIDQPLAHQQIGFLYSCGIQVTQPRLIHGSNLNRSRYRSAAVVDVRAANFDFVLIGLHLKSSRAFGSRELRSQQLHFVSGFIQGVTYSGEMDVLVVGDYNMIPGQDDENFAVLNSGGNLRLASSEALAGSFTHISRNGEKGNLLDGFAFTDIDGQEYQEGTLEIFPMNEKLGMTLSEFRAKVTDHLPIIATFDTKRDHD